MPATTPAEWRERWTPAAAAYGQSPPPEPLLDPPGMVEGDSAPLLSRNRAVAESALAEVVRLLSD